MERPEFYPCALTGETGKTSGIQTRPTYLYKGKAILGSDHKLFRDDCVASPQ
jgi:hypothetical protein